MQAEIILIPLEAPLYLPAFFNSASRGRGRGCKHSFDAIDRRVRKLPLWFWRL
jgi:hypothetical protein